mmetsp:Transcript_25895/g.67144  ORF Transcript_25895/g.67144 Transcript_25895/m.67144 type:complete len:83 (+) Transcript_25895:315-563(+)
MSSFFASVCESDTCGWRGAWRSKNGWLGHALDLNDFGDLDLCLRDRAQAYSSKPAGNTPETRLRTPQPRKPHARSLDNNIST